MGWPFELLFHLGLLFTVYVIGEFLLNHRKKSGGILGGMAPGRKRGAKGVKTKSELSLGDLVLAKVKGFPAWPAKVHSDSR